MLKIWSRQNRIQALKESHGDRLKELDKEGADAYNEFVDLMTGYAINSRQDGIDYFSISYTSGVLSWQCIEERATTKDDIIVNAYKFLEKRTITITPAARDDFERYLQSPTFMNHVRNVIVGRLISKV